MKPRQRDIDVRKLVEEARADLAALSRVDAPSVRAVRRRHSRALRAAPADLVIQFASALLEDGGWPERVIAYEVVASHRAALARVDDRLAGKFARGLGDWGSIDLFGVTLLGQAWRDGGVTDGAIAAWTRSTDRWRRRLALVATVPLNIRARGGTGDPARTLRVCRLLADDRDDMVVKALSWALRELAKRDPASVEKFMAREGDRLHSRVRREVGNKLTTGRKDGGSGIGDRGSEG